MDNKLGWLLVGTMVIGLYVLNKTVKTQTYEKTYIITAIGGEGGVISPFGNVGVPEGDNLFFDIQANTGMYISDLLIDGFTNQNAIGRTNYIYTFEDIRANHTITVFFEPL